MARGSFLVLSSSLQGGREEERKERRREGGRVRWLVENYR